MLDGSGNPISSGNILVSKQSGHYQAKVLFVGTGHVMIEIVKSPWPDINVCTIHTLAKEHMQHSQWIVWVKEPAP
jgi:hypothetical protein